jgi:2,4-dienoyl-CoA reductase-like NADH-dependent reductase (Old Yellow Enzyme family)
MPLVSRPNLLSPCRVGELEIKNRLILDLDDAVLNCHGEMDHSRLEDLYARAGMLISERMISPWCRRASQEDRARQTKRNSRDWRSLTQIVHANGGVIVCQVEMDGARECVGCRLSRTSGCDQEERFQIAAEWAMEVGFDGMELSVSGVSSFQGISADQSDKHAIPETGAGAPLGLVDIARCVSREWKGGGRVGARIPLAYERSNAPRGNVSNERATNLFSALEELRLMYVRIAEPIGGVRDQTCESERRRVLRDLRARFGGAYVATTECPESLQIGSPRSPDLVAVPWKLLEEVTQRRRFS